MTIESKPRYVFLASNVVDAIERYLQTPSPNRQDPSGLGGLNAIAWIGESVIVAYREARDAMLDHVDADVVALCWASRHLRANGALSSAATSAADAIDRVLARSRP